jgi:hypothetical protein
MAITADHVEMVGLYAVGLVSRALEAKRDATTADPRARDVQSRPFNAATRAKQPALHHLQQSLPTNSADQV